MPAPKSRKLNSGKGFAPPEVKRGVKAPQELQPSSSEVVQDDMAQTGRPSILGQWLCSRLGEKEYRVLKDELVLQDPEILLNFGLEYEFAHWLREVIAVHPEILREGSEKTVQQILGSVAPAPTAQPTPKKDENPGEPGNPERREGNDPL